MATAINNMVQSTLDCITRYMVQANMPYTITSQLARLIKLGAQVYDATGRIVYSGTFRAIVSTEVRHNVNCSLRIAESSVTTAFMRYNGSIVPKWYALLKGISNGAITFVKGHIEWASDYTHSALYGVCYMTAKQGTKEFTYSFRVCMLASAVTRLVTDAGMYHDSTDDTVEYNDDTIGDAF